MKQNFFRLKYPFFRPVFFRLSLILHTPNRGLVDSTLFFFKVERERERESCELKKKKCVSETEEEEEKKNIPALGTHNLPLILVKVEARHHRAHRLHHVEERRHRRPVLVRGPLVRGGVVDPLVALAPGRDVPLDQVLDHGLGQEQRLEHEQDRRRLRVVVRRRRLGRRRDRRVRGALGLGGQWRPPERLRERERVDGGRDRRRRGRRDLERLARQRRGVVGQPRVAVAESFLDGPLGLCLVQGSERFEAWRGRMASKKKKRVFFRE